MSLSVIDQSGIAAKGIGAANMHTGAVLQVVQSVRTAQIDISGTTSTTVLSCPITPISTASKILISVTSHAYLTTGGDISFGEAILRGSTSIYSSSEIFYFSGSTAQFEGWATAYVDSPATTSQITYNFNIVPANRGTIGYCRNGSCSMILMEIAG